MELIQYMTKLSKNKQIVLEEIKKFNYDIDVLNSSEKIVQMMNCIFQFNKLAEEFFYVIGFTNSMFPLGIFEVSHGTSKFTVINPREIFIRLLLIGATTFIVLHNHPSGSNIVSDVDIAFTKRLQDASNLIGLDFADHIIVCDTTYISLREQNYYLFS